MEASKTIQNYFDSIDKNLKNTYKVATDARKKGYDPVDKVEIPIARNMAERVEGLISAIAPQIVNSGISKRITELEKKYGSLDWRVALTIADEIAKQKFCKFDTQLNAIEIGVRVGFAYLTMGTVSSPLEGFTRIEIKKTRDGKEYFAVYYSGPVRSAGGTGAAVSLLITDYIRQKFGYASYDPNEKEIKRYSTELYDYHERVTNLQYLPSIEEIEFLAKNIPLQISGDPSEKFEVSNYKDLDRVETNTIRNGVCLVMGEGIAQKAPKVWKQLSKWGEDFGLSNWNFLGEFVKLQKNIKSKGQTTQENKKEKISPDYTFIADLVAGRPVLTHPLRSGGFRLRYGRSRVSGYSSCSVHPATMAVLNNYIAIGTQLKMERPGKATVLSSCDTLEGPIVLLESGDVIKLNSTKEAKKIVKEIKEILFLGDILVNYGDFFNRAHKLVPPGYCQEWWIQELERATVNLFGNIDIDKLSDLLEIKSEALEILIKNPLTTKITANAALIISEKLEIPIHPEYSFHWKTISKEEFIILVEWLNKSKLEKELDEIKKIILPNEKEPKRVLEILGIPHVIATEYVIIEKDYAQAIAACLNIENNLDVENIKKIVLENTEKNVLDLINIISKFKIKDKSGVFIGARMGRPEKAKIRQLTGSPHVLFPVGKEGDRLRSFQAALEAKKIRSDFSTYFCSKCNKETILPVCLECDKKTKKSYYCKICGVIQKEDCPKHGKAESFRTLDIDINNYFKHALKKLKTRTYPDLIKGVRGTSNKGHIPEHLIKGILRAKHNIYVNKDGTTRYDMTQMGLTHFRPKEIGTSVEKLRELGYEKDIDGKNLEDDKQILEIKPQDIVIPACFQSAEEGANKILFRVAKFVDDLLVNLYGLKPFYNLKNEEDLAGHLIVALAPHTSAGIIGRIIGTSKTQGFLAHPMLHAATRRDLDGDEASISLLMDVLINFSRHFLPSHRGSTQDAPLVLTSNLTPAEVDDMVFDLDIVSKYPLEFYEACMEYKNPWDVQIDQLGKRLGTEKQFEGSSFTHNTTNFNFGVKCSAYKTIPSMEEKLKGQMDIAQKIRAVDVSDVARLVIEKHFIKDIKGNLRKFSTQQFRCVKCNEKYRRPPLVGKCTKCAGRIIFTISEGSVVKYLEPSISIAEKYDLPSYLKQSLELVKRRIEGVFGREKEKQEGLGKWFG